MIKSTMVLLCAAIPTIYACSQPPAPPPPAGTAGPGRAALAPPPPGGPGAPLDRPIQELVTIQGNVKTYTASDSMQYDGFTLQNNNQTVNVRFPAHLGTVLMSSAKPGSTVTVQGFYENTPEGLNVIHLVNANVGGQTICDTPPAEPPVPQTLSIQTYTGTIAGFRRDRNGMPNGIYLSGNRSVDLGPGVYDQLQASLKTGTSISISGSMATPPAGVALVQQRQTIRPQTITINGQTYMVR